MKHGLTHTIPWLMHRLKRGAPVFQAYLIVLKVSDPLGSIGNAHFIIKGPSATFDSRWGDFEAASYDGFSTNHIWVASQYSISGDWATFIARV